MRVYENLLQTMDEWYITSTLYLDDDGFFRYDELWSCYLGSTISKADGTWQQTGDVVVLLTERIDGSPRLGLVEGRQIEAFERADGLDLGGGFVMIRRDATRADRQTGG